MHCTIHFELCPSGPSQLLGVFLSYFVPLLQFHNTGFFLVNSSLCPHWPAHCSRVEARQTLMLHNAKIRLHGHTSVCHPLIFLQGRAFLGTSPPWFQKMRSIQVAVPRRSLGLWNCSLRSATNFLTNFFCTMCGPRHNYREFLGW